MRWFYIREELGSTTFCDIGYVPEKRVSWTDRPEYTGLVEELMNLIEWSRLDGLGVVGNFLSDEYGRARGGSTRLMSTREAKT